MHAPDARAMSVRELDIRESCGSRRGGCVRLRAAQAAMSMTTTSTTATSGSASGGCAAATRELRLSTSQRRTSDASSVPPGGSSRSRACLATHDKQLGGDDERLPRPTTMAEVGGQGEQRAGACSGELEGRLGQRSSRWKAGLECRREAFAQGASLGLHTRLK